MKKVTLVLFIILSAVMMAACDGKKSGGGGESNTPIVADNPATFIGNYAVTQIDAKPASTNNQEYSTTDIKQITDFAGIMIIPAADASTTNIKGSFQVGGNTFIVNEHTSDKDTPAVAPIQDFTAAIATPLLTVDQGAQTIKFTSDAFDGRIYTITMKKISDNTNVDAGKAIWPETGLCYQPGTGGFFNCTVGTEANQDGSDNTSVNQASSALMLIGNYYLDSISIDSSSSICGSSAVTITRASNSLVGELSASAGLGGTEVVNGETKLIVDLGILLKFQFTDVSNCNFDGTNNGYQFYDLGDKIPVDPDATKIPFDQVFTDEGLDIQGTETIAYKPKTRVNGALQDDTRFAGVTFTFKKARNGTLLGGYAKPLSNQRYY